MAATMRKAVSHVTEVVFPPPKDYADIQRQQLISTSNDYVSNLPLQMALYFNVFFYPIWLITECVMFEAKWSSLTSLYQIIVTAIIIVMTVVEIIRLYLGYVGNLTEKVPELAGSWLLTLLLQLPLIMFMLLNEATIILPLERAVHIVMTIFVVFEVVVGFFAIRAMVNSQMVKFHLHQFEDLEEIHREELRKGHMYENRYTQ